MRKTERRGRRSAADWRGMLKRFRESGLSVRSFCEREGLGRASFYQWRVRLSAPSSRTRREAESKVAEAGGFVDLGALNAREPRFELRLDLGAGVQLHLVRS